MPDYQIDIAVVPDASRFPAELSTEVAKAEARQGPAKIDVAPHIGPEFARATKLDVDKALAGLDARVALHPELAKTFRAQAQALTRDALKASPVEVPIVGKVAPGFRADMQASIRDAAKGGIEVPLIGRFTSGSRADMQAQIRELSSTTPITVPVSPVLDQRAYSRFVVDLRKKLDLAGGVSDVRVRPGLMPAFGADLDTKVAAETAAVSASPAAEVHVRADTRVARTEIAKVGEEARVAGEGGDALSARITKGLGGIVASAVGAAALLTKVGDEFHAAYSEIIVQTGATGAALDRLKGNVRAVAADVPESLGQVAAAVAGVNVRLNLSGPLLSEVSTQMLDMSRITGTDLTGNLTSVTAALESFRITGENVPKALDMIFRASQKSGVSVTAIGDTIKQFGSALRAAGYDFAGSVALLTQLQHAGIPATGALISLSIAAKKLAKEGKDPAVAISALVKQIHDAKNETQALYIAQAVFGRGSVAVTDAIRSGKFQLGEFLTYVKSGKPTIHATAETVSDAAESWKIFKNRMSLALETPASQFFNSLTSTMRGLGPAIAQIAPLLGGVTSAFGAIAIGLVRSLIPALNIVLPLLQPIATIAQQAFSAAGPMIADMARLISAALIPALSQVPALLAPILKVLATELPSLVKSLMPTFLIFGATVAHVMQQIGPLLANLVGRVLTAAAPIIPKLATALLKMAESLGKLLIAVVPLMGPMVSLLTQVLTTSAVTVLSALATAIGAIATALVHLPTWVLTSLADGLLGLLVVREVMRQFQRFGTIVGDGIRTIDSWGSKVRSAYGSIKDFSGTLQTNEQVFSGWQSKTVAAASTAAGALSGYFGAMAETTMGRVTAAAGAVTSIIGGFAAGGPWGAALAGIAVGIGYIFGSAAEKSQRAKEAIAANAAALRAEAKDLTAAWTDAFSNNSADTFAGRFRAAADLMAQKFKQGDEGARGFTKLFQGAIGDVSLAAAKGADAVKGYTDGLMNAQIMLISAGDKNAAKRWSTQIDDAAGSIRSHISDLASEAAGNMAKIGDSAETAGAHFDRASKGISAAVKGLGAGDSLDVFRTKLEAAGLSVEQSQKQVAVYLTSLRDQLKNSPAGRYLAELSPAMLQAISDQDNLAHAQELAKSPALQYADAWNSAKQAVTDATSAYSAWIDQVDGRKPDLAAAKLAVLDQADALAKLGTGTRDTLQKTVDLRDAQKSFAPVLAQMATDAKGSYGAFQQKVESLRAEMMGPALEAFHGNKVAAMEFVATITAMPSEKTFKQKISGVDEARLKAQQLHDQILWIAGEHKATLKLTIETVQSDLLKEIAALQNFTAAPTSANLLKVLATMQAFANTPKGAEGGIFTKATHMVIGEAGPEVLLPLTDPRRARELVRASGLLAVLGMAPAAGTTAARGGGAGGSGAVNRGGANVGVGWQLDVAPLHKWVDESAKTISGLGKKFTDGSMPPLDDWRGKASGVFTKLGDHVSTFSRSTSDGLHKWAAETLPAGTLPNLDTWHANVVGRTVDTARGMLAAVTTGQSLTNAVFGRSMDTMVAASATGGVRTVDAMAKALGIGTDKVKFIASGYVGQLAAGLDPILKAVGQPQIKLAGGGYVPGPDVRRDIVPAWLMPREFVFTRDRTDQYGAQALALLNRGITPPGWYVPNARRYAGGGVVTGDTAGLNPEFKSRLTNWSAAVGQTYNVISGYRSIAQQTQMYQDYIAGRRGTTPVAPPGLSMHNYGLASDGNQWGNRNPGAFGLRYPMSYEPWHVEPNEARLWRDMIRRGVMPGPDASNGATITGLAPLAKPPGMPFSGMVSDVASKVLSYAYDVALKWAGGQSLAGAASSSAVLATLPVNIRRVLDTIGFEESGNNYNAQNPSSSAFGRYQFLLSTYVALARQFGLSAGHSPAEQDAIAARYVEQIDASAHGDLRAFPVTWYVGHYTPGMNLNYVPRGNTISVADYVAKWLREYASLPGYAEGGLVAAADGARYADIARFEPLTKPNRSTQIGQQQAIERLLLAAEHGGGRSGPQIEGDVILQVIAPENQDPANFGMALSHRVIPMLAGALNR